MEALPGGTLTLFFSDIEGSTRPLPVFIRARDEIDAAATVHELSGKTTLPSVYRLVIDVPGRRGR